MKPFASPLDNRVSAFGDIIATPQRGTLMGNRGCLHDDEEKICREWRGLRWIICELSYYGQKEHLRRPGSYTPLFFENEASALAAGHRPCALCRRGAYRRFKSSVEMAKGLSPGSLTANSLDELLHIDRLVPLDHRRTLAEAEVFGLPDGAVIARGKRSYWVQDGRLNAMAWPSNRKTKTQDGSFVLLTPEISTAALATGYDARNHLGGLGGNSARC